MLAKRIFVNLIGALVATVRAVPSLLRDLVGLAGAALCAYGAWLVYAPAGFIFGGILLLAGAMLSARNA
jgi:hypothetical protein